MSLDAPGALGSPGIGVRGLNVFPLTPMRSDAVDETAFVGLVERCAAAGVDAITALGSTGSYAYLSRAERKRVAQLAVRHAGSTPVCVGVGALRTSDVVAAVHDAADAGAASVLLAPVSYQPLTAADVTGLYETVVACSDLPVVLYDNPATTHFTFTPELTARIAALPGIASVKVAAAQFQADTAAVSRGRLAQLRAMLPETVTVGAAGDGAAGAALNAGCDAWYSVLGGVCPELAVTLTRAAQQGDPETASRLSGRLQPLWDLYAEWGSLRVVAGLAELHGAAPESCLPLPIRGLEPAQRERLERVSDALPELAELRREGSPG